MRTLGLVGGISWVSTADYYKLLNEEINRRCGGHTSVQCLLYSFNFAEIKELQDRGEWPEILRRLTDISRRMADAGAECLLLCANTMHAVADDLRGRIGIPLLHIAEATALAIERRGLARVGLLGTRFTMEMDFFRNKLAARGIDALTPEEGDRGYVHTTIFDELARGRFLQGTKEGYLAIIERLAARGAQGVILGCTEIPLLLKPSDTPLPLFDTVAIHVDEAIRFALGDQT